MSGAEYYEPDAKLLSVDRGGVREQHRAKSEDRGDIREPNELSSVEHGEIHGRGGTQSVEHGAIRGWHAGRKVSEYGAIRRPGTAGQVPNMVCAGNGAIQKRYRVQDARSGAIRKRRGALSVEYGAIRERCGVPSAALRSDL